MYVLKIRIRFEKQGQMKFIGHLDMVRYFQKVMRRANVDICYSEGFSPHQKMSFAAPLSVGVISKGEYFDIEVNSSLSSKEMIKNINAQNVEGVKVVSYKELPEGAKNAMSIVAGADYFVYTDLFTEEQVNDFYAQDEINILKKTKKSEKIVDIKPMIHEMKFNEDGIFMKVSQGSAANLKPDLVMSALEQFTGAKLPEFVQYERMDMYCLENDKLVSLSEIGGNIE
ncbi:TIGR03936 family radical SAM-associated protein [uncultured Eubacterium sp.]|uniref:TIGR03936 family radical SAM-associated protein n=1 Tax=Eubacterium sp. TaxID=142586 RepID=UPI0025F4ACB3|nr:TIGR03936 family radical SAM-associated protein [uncultured Eubacterium sp.]